MADSEDSVANSDSFELDGPSASDSDSSPRGTASGGVYRWGNITEYA